MSDGSRGAGEVIPSSSPRNKAIFFGAVVGTFLASPVSFVVTGLGIFTAFSNPVSGALLCVAGVGVLPAGAVTGAAGVVCYTGKRDNFSSAGANNIEVGVDEAKQPTSSCDNSTRDEKNEKLSSDDQSQSGREDENPPSYESIAVL